jgi:hypothetical protein
MFDEYDIFQNKESPPVSALISYPLGMMYELDDNPCLEFVTLVESNVRTSYRTRPGARRYYREYDGPVETKGYAIYRIVKARILPDIFTEGDLVDDEMADLLGIGQVAPEGKHLTQYDINPRPRNRIRDYDEDYDWDDYDSDYRDDNWWDYSDAALEHHYEQLNKIRYEFRSRRKRTR